jgi:hypothetical protein
MKVNHDDAVTFKFMEEDARIGVTTGQPDHCCPAAITPGCPGTAA